MALMIGVCVCVCRIFEFWLGSYPCNIDAIELREQSMRNSAHVPTSVEKNLTEFCLSRGRTRRFAVWKWEPAQIPVQAIKVALRGLVGPYRGGSEETHALGDFHFATNEGSLTFSLFTAQSHRQNEPVSTPVVCGHPRRSRSRSSRAHCRCCPQR